MCALQQVLLMQFRVTDADPMSLMLASDSSTVPSSIHMPPYSPWSSINARASYGKEKNKHRNRESKIRKIAAVQQACKSSGS